MLDVYREIIREKLHNMTHNCNMNLSNICYKALFRQSAMVIGRLTSI